MFGLLWSRRNSIGQTRQYRLAVDPADSPIRQDVCPKSCIEVLRALVPIENGPLEATTITFDCDGDGLVDSDPTYSTPDDLSPRDRQGHGTAIAMIAAGVQNAGPLGSITGVAPKAR